MQDLKASGKTMLVCTHDLEFVREHCTRAIWLDRGRVRLVGDPVEVSDAYTSASEDAGRPDNETMHAVAI
jgi:ABC-type polysaccharide/polyol phosphate transport system ATPase subunit